MQPPCPTNFIEPRFVAIDSSHLAAIAGDRSSTNPSRRSTAQKFEATLLDTGLIPLLSWHHIEELLQHRDDSVVANRVKFLQSLPIVAWIRCSTGLPAIGSVVDIFAAEVAAALKMPGAGRVAVRNCAAKVIFDVGAGAQAMAPYVDIWRDLRAILWTREERAREIVAISRSEFVDIDETKVVDWLAGEIRSPADARRQLSVLRARLADDIALRGDKRIPDPTLVANAFFDEVEENGMTMISRTENPALHFLLQQDIEVDDIKPETTMAEIYELAEFRKKLRVANENLGLDWTDLIRRVSKEQIPCWLIQSSLKRYGHDQHERKGSDLVDSYLACLAAYADITCVDKRTKENVRRARQKSPDFAALVRQIEKASHYSQIA